MTAIPGGKKEDDDAARQDADAEVDEQPPAYDALSIHHVSDDVGSPAPGPSGLHRPSGLHPGNARLKVDTQTYPIDKALPQPPSTDSPVTTTSPTSTEDDTSSSSSSEHAQPQIKEEPRKRKNNTWRSLFTSSRSAKQIRQSVLSTIHDLISSPTPSNIEATLASCVESCAERKLAFSTILQEYSIAEHTPMYWAIVNYREELLVSLLRYARPLGARTVSDIRCACLVSSNQALFHALRVRRPPFHDTDVFQGASLRVASDGLLLGSRPPDEIHVHESGIDGAFITTFDIALWQRRMRTGGRVSIEFIASGRIWCLTFFSTDPPSLGQTKGKAKKRGDIWHVMITVLESSPPTFIDCQLVIEVLHVPTRPTHLHAHTLSPHAHPLARQLRQMRSASFTPPSGGPMVYDHGHSGMTSTRVLSPPPVSSSVGARPLVFRLCSGTHKLAHRVKSGTGVPDPSESLSTKPVTWSEKGTNYMNAIVCPLGEGVGSHLMYENSRYLFSDGTLRARLEARLVKSESSKDCVIC